jgi:DNA-directed RNA polymerase subunit RPC12/RpoP
MAKASTPTSANKQTPWQKQERSRKWFGLIMGIGMAGPVLGSGVAVLKDEPLAAGVLLVVGGVVGIVWLARSRRTHNQPLRRFPSEALTTGAVCPVCGERIFHKRNAARAAEVAAAGEAELATPKPTRLVCTKCGNDRW